jgi:NADH:ubiquinone oxidoreductase subunit K
MSKSAVLALSSLLFVLALVRVVYAADETLVEQFLGSPLLILAAVIIIAALASLYHGIRR